MFVWPFQGHLYFFVTWLGGLILGGSEGNTSTSKACVDWKHMTQQSTSMGEWFLSLGGGNGVCF